MYRQQATTEELKIGVVASMTGPASTTGKDIWQSAQLAADEINANGGVYITDLNKKVPIRLCRVMMNPPGKEDRRLSPG